jgi:3'-phosphoadenosine 5'-phosphosulfate sulfotransferase (PAPS reductase)/FAD synthetase
MAESIKEKSALSNVKMVPTDDIVPYEGNVKQHSVSQIRRVSNSLLSYGWDQPIVVDKEMVIIKGHARWMAARDLGMEEVPVAINDTLSEEDVRLARIADNKVGESEWNDHLWDELNVAHEEGIRYVDMGFDSKDIRRLFPDLDWTSLGIELRDSEKEKERFEEEGRHDDPTRPQIEGFIAPHTGEDTWLRHLDMVDYLNWHDKVLVGFSGGKDSLAALVWCLEHLEREKVVPYFSNLAWGVDWPHGIVFVQLIEKMYDCKVNILGPTDPAAPMRWEDLLLQHGYPESYSCWYRNYVKIRNVRAFIHQEKFHPKYGMNAVQILAVRWDESRDRALKYPDRGFLKDDGLDYASPLIQWTDADIIDFLQERDIMLHTAYQHSNRMGCIVCPNEDRRGCINSRKKFPLLYKQILDWHGKGARRKGRLQKQHFTRMVSSIGDLSDQEIQMFRGVYGGIALGSKEFENYVEEKLGITLPQKPYVVIPYDKDLHNFRTDLKQGSFEDPTTIKETSCELTG